MKFPKIGLRNIKTAVAVFFALLVKVILMITVDRYVEGFSKIVYTPFFAAIAAAYSMNTDKKSSIKQAKIRCMGSIIGGIYGMLIVMLLYAIMGTNGFNTAFECFILYTVVAASIIFMIHLTVVSKKTYATWIACLTYLSVTVSIRNDFDELLIDQFNKYVIVMIFAFNRIISTIIGVAISLGVNLFRLPRNKNNKVLFVSSLDNAILNKEHQITGYTKYKINNMVKNDASLTFATTRTQASLNQIFNDVELSLPIITMNGSAIYNPKTRHYSKVINIDNNARTNLDQLFLNNNVNAFSYTVFDDILQVYHNKITNEGETKYYKDRKNNFFDNYVRGIVPSDLDVAFYVIVDKEDVIFDLVNKINQTDYRDKLDLLYYEYDIKGYYFLKINSRKANKYICLAALKEEYGFDNLVVFGSGSSDIDMMNMADIAIAMSNAPKLVKDAADYIIENPTADAILKEINRLYHTRNLRKIIDENNK